MFERGLLVVYGLVFSVDDVNSAIAFSVPIIDELEQTIESLFEHLCHSAEYLQTLRFYLRLVKSGACSPSKGQHGRGSIDYFLAIKNLEARAKYAGCSSMEGQSQAIRSTKDLFASY